MKRPGFFLRAAGAAILTSLAACQRTPTPAPAPVIEPAAAESPTALPTPAPVPKPAFSFFGSSEPTPRPIPVKPPPLELWKEYSGDRAMEEVKQEVDLGPRPAGSPELAQTRAVITAGLKRSGWRVEEQVFTDDTPRGPIRFVNLIARFGQAPAGDHEQTIVCSHYDTKRFSTIRFVGASDGASSSGALVELARVLALDPALAARVELVFFDGEEAVQQFNETDGLYGSRYYARTLRDTGRAKLFKMGVLWDMIGDRDLTITLPPNSPPDLAQGIFSSSEMLGVRTHFAFFNRDITDDHVPLNTFAKIPSIDLIDFDYLPWHTADDTLDKLAPESLRIIGAVTVYYLKRTFPR